MTRYLCFIVYAESVTSSSTYILLSLPPKHKISQKKKKKNLVDEKIASGISPFHQITDWLVQPRMADRWAQNSFPYHTATEAVLVSSQVYSSSDGTLASRAAGVYESLGGKRVGEW